MNWLMFLQKKDLSTIDLFLGHGIIIALCRAILPGRTGSYESDPITVSSTLFYLPLLRQNSKMDRINCLT
jgi:hypothetical protein